MANFRKETYATWQEASAVMKKFGIKNQEDYVLRYDRIDPLLPSSPGTWYKDFPGWRIFLDNKVAFYPTWKESVEAAKKLGIKNMKEYKEKYREDPRLRSNPNIWYKDFIWNPCQFMDDPIFLEYLLDPVFEFENDEKKLKLIKPKPKVKERIRLLTMSPCDIMKTYDYTYSQQVG